KGTAKTVLLDPKSQQFNEAVSKWREGDKAIVLHTYGGIGGKKPEPEPLGVVTGHFAYGIATVVRDRFTDELRFDIEYRQVYAHNPDGIIAGTMKWSTYMGDLQRGWLGNRPVSDVIVKLDAVTQDYNFDGIQLSPMKEFMRQLDIMMARYRIGDGTGSSVVTPSTSCVQDANQALFVTIKQVEKQVASNPRIQEWLRRHPTDAQTLRFQQLVKLGRSLEKQLAPLGIIRSDWQENADNLAGTRTADGTLTTILKAATTWRTMLPRRAHDEMATILLNNGATLWVIRTNQVGGFNPDIVPRAPTALLGHRTN
ncbi:MAG: abortive infection protein, partial [Cyanobacteriota bacterium]